MLLDNLTLLDDLMPIDDMFDPDPDFELTDIAEDVYAEWIDAKATLVLLSAVRNRLSQNGAQTIDVSDAYAKAIRQEKDVLVDLLALGTVLPKGSVKDKIVDVIEHRLYGEMQRVMHLVGDPGHYGSAVKDRVREVIQSAVAEAKFDHIKQ